MPMKQTGRKVYKSANGKTVDMDLLRQKNELTPAVGNARVNARFDFLEKLLVEKGNSVYKYPINDANLISLFEVIHATDWLSIWASDEKKVNNMEVGIIMELKGFLASHT